MCIVFAIWGVSVYIFRYVGVLLYIYRSLGRPRCVFGDLYEDLQERIFYEFGARQEVSPESNKSPTWAAGAGKAFLRVVGERGGVPPGRRKRWGHVAGFPRAFNLGFSTPLRRGRRIDGLPLLPPTSDIVILGFLNHVIMCVGFEL